MLSWLSKWFGPTAPAVPEYTEQLRLSGHDQRFFEQAVKLYIFARHTDSRHIAPELAEQLSYCAHIVYSLMINWMRDGKPSIEYLDFLNTRLNDLRSLPASLLAGLEIQPHEIQEIELMKQVRLQFTDEETGALCALLYEPESGLCRFGFSEGKKQD